MLTVIGGTRPPLFIKHAFPENWTPKAESSVIFLLSETAARFSVGKGVPRRIIMELDVKGATAYEPVRERPQRTPEEKPKQKTEENKVAEVQLKQQIEEQRQKSLISTKNVDAPKYLREILRFTEIFNKKLKFNIDEESEQVIVKVIDSETDKVIKEIPPEELQRLYSSMKEAIGLLIDEQR